MKRWMQTLVVSAAVVSLAACGANTDNNGNNGNNGNGMNANRSGTVRNLGMRENTGNFNHFWNGFDNDIRDNVPGNQGAGMHRNSRMEASDDLAERIAAMRHVDRAMVFLTDHNAYVGVVLDNDARTQGLAGTSTDGSDMDFGRPETNDGVSKKLKDEIGQTVKSQRPEIRNVFVSANPGFVDSLNDYMNDIEQGRPVTGLIEQFNDMVERIFPTRSGDGFDNARNGVNDMGNARGTNNGSYSPFTTRAR